MINTTAAVIAGKNNIAVQQYALPAITPDELLVKVVSNSLCLSTYKALTLGEDHKRVPDNINSQPIITGHEFAGVIEAVGANLTDRYQAGKQFVLQPAMGLPSGYSAGYSYPYFGGNATYCIIPKVAIDLGCVLPYGSQYFANASLAEPMSCIIGAFHANYHTKPYVYQHEMGVKQGGKIALLGCAGPMGIGAIDYAVNGPYQPQLVVVVDVDEQRLKRAEALISPSAAQEKGVRLVYLNTRHVAAVQALQDLSDGTGYDDVFVFAAAADLVEQADDILANDGCLNFFAGPMDKKFKVPFNFYNVHYESTHIVGTSGGSTGDMLESLQLAAAGIINPSYMITHIGGINAVPDAKRNLPKLAGGKKIIYPHIEMELTAIDDFERLGENNPLFRQLGEICRQNNNVWCEQAEKVLLAHYGV